MLPTTTVRIIVARSRDIPPTFIFWTFVPRRGIAISRVSDVFTSAVAVVVSTAIVVNDTICAVSSALVIVPFVIAAMVSTTFVASRFMARGILL